MAETPYDNSKDPLYLKVGADIGRRAPIIPKSDTEDLDRYAVVVVVSAGDVVFLPAISDDADPITMAALPVGYIIPWQVRRVLTATTAEIRALDKVY
jgi:hypothetical protein